MTPRSNWRDRQWAVVDKNGDEFQSAHTVAISAKEANISNFDEAVNACRDFNDDPQMTGIFTLKIK